MAIACLHARPPSQRTADRDPRRPARPRAQDQPRLHSTQGERLQHSAAAGDGVG